jgi:hypothetical protein
MTSPSTLERSIMNVFILLLSWLGLLAGPALPPPPPPVPGGGDCPDGGCGLNGTQLTGLAVDLPDSICAVALPTGDLILLR